MQTAESLANYRKITNRIRSKGIPAVAILETTYACNLSCRHCYVSDSGSAELEFKDYRRLIDDLVDLGTFCLVFTGGEPLLRSDLFDIAGYADQQGFLKVLFTNGTLIDEPKAAQIRQAGFWKVEMSIYGACADTHDRITRRRGSFQKTLNALRLLRENGLDVSLKTLLLNLNIAEYRAMRDLTEDLGIDLRADFQINPKLDGDLKPLKYSISTKDMTSVMKTRSDISIFSCNGFQSADTLTCNAGKHMLSISPAGDVKPCVIFPVTCGNVKRPTLNRSGDPKTEYWVSSGPLNRMIFTIAGAARTRTSVSAAMPSVICIRVILRAQPPHLARLPKSDTNYIPK